jgi:hypothetical protein
MKITHAVAAAAAVVALAGTAACEDLNTDQPGTAADRANTKNAAKKDAKNVDTAQAAKPNTKAKSSSKPKPAAPKETAGQAQARQSAAEYLDMEAFSRSGLIDQLKFEGYSVADATYGVDAQHANWNDQAALSAKEYLDMDSFSHSGLVEQLTFEGYTQQQAEYGVNQVGL